MYYDNPNPFGRDYYRDMMCKEARRTFSRFHFGIFAYVAVAYLITIIADIALMLVFKDSYETITANIYYQWIMGVLPMYAVGLPVLCIIVRGIPSKRLEKSKMNLSEFLILFAIAQAAMFIGNSIGTSLNNFFAAIKGDEISNTTSDLIENSPIWITILVAVIIGPIIEEFIFRKLLVDKLSRYGTLITVIVSGVSFGLFHGNFYQFFYAAMLGMILAYITIKTGNWLYSVVMHVLINFFGSVAVLPVIDLLEEFTEASEALANGEAINVARFLICAMAVVSYSVIQYALVIAGIYFIVLSIKNRWYKLRSTAEVNIPKNDAFGVAYLNAGAIVFVVTSILLFGVSIILG